MSDTEIKIGMVNAQSGPASSLGIGMLQGARAVFKDINARGGIHGRQIKLLTADDGYEPDNTTEETLKMVQQHRVFSLFGYVGTPTTNAVLPILAAMEVPLVGAFTGAMSLRVPVSEQVFNVRASYDNETEALVGRLIETGAKRIGVVYQYDGFGLAVLQGTEKALARRGMKVAALGSFKRNSPYVTDAVTSMTQAQPDAIIMAGPYRPLATFVLAAKRAALRAQLATVSFVGTDQLLQLVGAHGEDMLISQVVPLPSDTGVAVVDECRRLLSLHPGVDMGFVNLEGCISARVLVLALQSAGPELTRQGLRAALESMKAVDLGGLSITLTGDDHQASTKVYLTRIQKGQVITQAPPAGPLTPALASR